MRCLAKMTEIKKLDFASLQKPIAEVSIGEEKIQLYPPRARDIAIYTDIPKGETSLNRVKKFLGAVASINNKDKSKRIREALEPNFINNLSDSEVEKMAEAYISTPYIHAYSNELKIKIDSRNSEEAATNYLEKVLSAHFDDLNTKLKDTFSSASKQMSSIFDSVRASGATLDKIGRAHV